MNEVDLTAEEQEELNEWLQESEQHRRLYEEIKNPAVFRRAMQEMSGYDSQALWQKISNRVQGKKTKPVQAIRRNMMRYAAAAIILFLLGGAVYYLINNKKEPGMSMASQPGNLPVHDLAAASEKATLILNDGSTLVLDNSSNGEIVKQGNATVIKEDGLLAYNSDNGKSSSTIFYNTLKTGKGEHYSSLVLSDGTKVWLNAVSSIRFPASFTGKERLVEVTGEVYFEVAKNVSLPFRVLARGSEIEVLGTKFNINAYEDESTIKTSLVEGSIRLRWEREERILNPGQQVIMQKDAPLQLIEDADLEEVTAWKNGRFKFSGTPIEEIMRQVARWYDVEIQYEGKVSHHAVASISRTVPVSKLLQLLELTDRVHFKVDGRKITVTP